MNKNITEKPLILAVETSGRIGSVAIALGGQLLSQTAFSGPMRHSAEIFPAVSSLLKSSSRNPRQIEHVYISIGPGSFTGLRIAAAFAKSMHLANAAKIIAVDTLDVIAANITDLTTEEPAVNKIAAVLDAKRSQFFIAAYERNTSNEQRATNNETWNKILPDSLLTVEQFLGKFADRTEPTWLLGEGLVYYKDKFEADGIKFLNERYWTPQAANVHIQKKKKALACQFADPLALQPTYLRTLDIKPKIS